MPVAIRMSPVAPFAASPKTISSTRPPTNDQPINNSFLRLVVRLLTGTSCNSIRWEQRSLDGSRSVCSGPRTIARAARGKPCFPFLSRQFRDSDALCPISPCHGLLHLSHRDSFQVLSPRSQKRCFIQYVCQLRTRDPGVPRSLSEINPLSKFLLFCVHSRISRPLMSGRSIVTRRSKTAGSE